MSGKTNGTNIRHETKADKKGLPPSTVVADPGTSKRNILRKGGKGHTRKEQAAGSQLDDGSTFDDPSNMDVNDPNYDPDEQYLNESYIPSDSTLEIGKAKMKLSAYKKLVEPLIKEVSEHKKKRKVYQFIYPS